MKGRIFMRPFIFLQTTNLHLHLADQQRVLLQTTNTHIILINIFKPKHTRKRQPFSYEHNDEILNFYNNRSTNAAAESFNAKIKLFRANLHGVTDKKFFLFKIAKLYGYPHQIPTVPIRHQNNLMLKPNFSKQIFMKQRTKVFLFRIAQAHRYPTRFLRPT